MTRSQDSTREIRIAPSVRRGSALFWAVLACVLAMPPSARADSEGRGESGMVWAARACYLEATWRESDCIALLYVVRKRAARVDRDWLDVLRDYSALFANNPRAKEVRAYPWGDVPGKSATWNRRWEQLRNLVVEVASGQHEDPCPRAEHWGGKMDKPRGRMVKARCAASTANTFYAVTKAK
jgi:hypothetical protein